MNIICLSIEGWYKRCGRKQQLFYALAKEFEDIKIAYVFPHKYSLGRWRAQDCTDQVTNTFLDKLPNMRFFTPGRPFPLDRNRFVQKLNRILSLKGMQTNVRDFFGSTHADVLWIYQPFNAVLLRKCFFRGITVFDWTEDWVDFFTRSSQFFRKQVAESQKDCLRLADIVFTVSLTLQKQAQKLNSHVYLLPNATNKEHLSGRAFMHQPKPEALRFLGGPILGWIGSVSGYIDFELVDRLAQSMPKASIVFLGEVHKDYHDKVESIKRNSNVHVLGLVSYEEMPNFIRFFDVCIAPYSKQASTGDSTKMYDYLAAGKPVVTTDVPSVYNARPHIKIAESHDAFIQCVKDALNKSHEKMDADIDEFLSRTDWAARAKTVRQILRGAIKENYPNIAMPQNF